MSVTNRPWFATSSGDGGWRWRCSLPSDFRELSSLYPHSDEVAVYSAAGTAADNQCLLRLQPKCIGEPATVGGSAAL